MTNTLASSQISLQSKMCTSGILAQIVASLVGMNELAFIYSFRILSSAPEMNTVGIMANTSILYAG